MSDIVIYEPDSAFGVSYCSSNSKYMEAVFL